MAETGQTLLLHAKPPLSGLRMTCTGSASRSATTGVQLALSDGRDEEAETVTLQEEAPKGCPPYRRWPSGCQNRCAFPEWAKNYWPCRALCHGEKNHVGVHLCTRHWGVNPDDWHAGRMTHRRAMDSAVAASRGASQPAADRFPTPGTSRSASGAPLVQHPLERRQARDGGWYTMQEFQQYYRSFSAWRWHWDTAVLPVVPPSVLLSAVASIPRIASAAAGKPEVLIQPNCMRCDWLGSGVELDSELRVVRREPVCRACNAIAPPSRIYVYDELF